MFISYGRSNLGVALCLCFMLANSSFAFGNNPKETRQDTTTIHRQASSSSDDSLAKNLYNDYLPKWYDMITRIPGDWLEYTEGTFQAKNIPAFMGVAGATAALMVTDHQWWQTERKWYNESPTFHTFSDCMVFTGDGRFQFGIVGAFASYGFVVDDARSLRTASELTEAILACGGVVQFLKHITGRESPFVSTKRTGAWRFFPNQIQYSKHVPHYDAFPSGHLATATTTLIVIAENYPDVTWLRPVGYVALGAISTSLVGYGIHWWSDYPLALVLGYSFAEIVTHPVGVAMSNKHGNDNLKLSFSPVALPDGVGLGMTLSF